METLLLILLILILLGVIPVKRWSGRSFTLAQVLLIILVIWLITRIF